MSKGKILVVDDSPTQMSLMRAPFEENGFEVITATDGEGRLLGVIGFRTSRGSFVGGTRTDLDGRRDP